MAELERRTLEVAEARQEAAIEKERVDAEFQFENFLAINHTAQHDLYQ